MYRLEVKTLGRGTGASTVNAAAHNTGKSAIKAVAYRAREALYDERMGKTHDYSRKFGGNGSEVFLPDGAPAWMADREARWNAVERSEPRKDAKLARDLVISLPYGMTHEQHREAVKEFVIKHFVSKGRFADVGYHAYGEPTKVTDKGLKPKLDEWTAKGLPFYERHELADKADHQHVAVLRNKKGAIKEYALFQPHAHVMVPLRTVEGDGFSKTKEREPPGVYYKVWYSQVVTEMRVEWANVLNKHLEKCGLPDRVTHLSLAAQGIDREPEPKKGPIAAKMEREGRGDESHAIIDWRAVKERNEQRQSLDERKVKLDAEIIDLLSARLQQMREGTRPVEVPEQQFVQRDDEIRNRAEAMGEQRERVAAFDRQYDEEQKRIIRMANTRDERMESQANRGDPTDANDRWSKAQHDSYNPLARPEHNLAHAVGIEAERFRDEQKEFREREAAEADPAKKKMLEFDRQISACDYMQIGAERCANIAGFIVGKRDNAISNRDREHAEEWKEIGAKLRHDRFELRQTMNQGLHEQIEAFLKDQTKGYQPGQSQRPQQETEAKEQLFGLGDQAKSDYEKRSAMGRDLPPGQQPTPHEHDPRQTGTYRDVGKDEIMPDGARYRTNRETGRLQVYEEAQSDRSEKDKTEPNRDDGQRATRDAKREVSDPKAERHAAMQARLDASNARAHSPGRSMGGRSR